MKKSNPRVAIYCRVSTKNQSTDLQLRDLQSYCQARGWTQLSVFEDVAESGSKESRPELNKLMNAVRKRQVDVVLVWRFDRFARSTKHLVQALEEFISLGVEFISFQENLDTSSAMGRAMFTIIGSMAQLERDIIVERVKAGMAAAKAKGKVLGRKRTRPENEIQALRAQGLSYRAIAKRLDTSLGAVQRALKVS